MKHDGEPGAGHTDQSTTSNRARSNYKPLQTGGHHASF